MNWSGALPYLRAQSKLTQIDKWILIFLAIRMNDAHSCTRGVCILYILQDLRPKEIFHIWCQRRNYPLIEQDTQYPVPLEPQYPHTDFGLLPSRREFWSLCMSDDVGSSHVKLQMRKNGKFTFDTYSYRIIRFNFIFLAQTLVVNGRQWICYPLKSFSFQFRAVLAFGVLLLSFKNWNTFCFV